MFIWAQRLVLGLLTCRPVFFQAFQGLERKTQPRNGYLQWENREWARRHCILCVLTSHHLKTWYCKQSSWKTSKRSEFKCRTEASRFRSLKIASGIWRAEYRWRRSRPRLCWKETIKLDAAVFRECWLKAIRPELAIRSNWARVKLDLRQHFDIILAQSAHWLLPQDYPKPNA